MGCNGPYGIAITPDIHKKLPEDVKKSWEVFDAWW